MNNYKTSNSTLVFLLVTSLLILNGCNEPVDLQSKWLDREIVIDANDNDWQDYTLFYDEKIRSSIGVFNDDANLYLCFQTMDEGIQRKILSQGLFVWFNKTGGKDKELCVCFPTGRRSFGPGGFPGRSSDMPGPPPGRSSEMSGPPTKKSSSDRNIPPGRPFGRDSDTVEEIRLFTSDKDEGRKYTFKEAANLGIFARYLVDQKKRFIYELKIRLAEIDKAGYTTVSEANRIGIGFMTAKSASRSRSGGMGGEPGGDIGIGRNTGGMGGGMGGMPGGSRGRSGKSLEIWANVTLASKPSNVQ